MAWYALRETGVLMRLPILAFVLSSLVLVVGCPSGDDDDVSDDDVSDDDVSDDDVSDDDVSDDDDDDVSDDDVSDDDTVEDLPDFPKLLLLVERNESMAAHWDDDEAEPTRWQVVADAIMAAVAAAPPQMEFALVGTAEPGDHWRPISAFDQSDADLSSSLAIEVADVGTRYIASTYAYALENYVNNSDPDAALQGWDAMAFAEPSTAVHAVIIGNGIGDYDDADVDNQIFVDDMYLSADPAYEEDQTLLDDVAYYAINNDLNTHHAGVQTVRTHTILVNAAITDPYADGFYWMTSLTGSGTYSAVNAPDEMEAAITEAVDFAVDLYSTN